MEACIKQIKGREILDSRGNPTVEAEVTLYDGTIGYGAVPSGASTGQFESLELRDNDKERYGGKGVLKAVSHVNGEIATLLTNKNVLDLNSIDKMMLGLDNTQDKSRLGANAILAVSIACTNAGAQAVQLPLYRYIGGVSGIQLPIPMMNILNGGAHADNNIDIQEFMIMPVGATNFKEGLRWCCEVYHKLASILKANKLATAVGDEGGFAPNLNDEEEAIELIIKAIQEAGYQCNSDFMIAIDAASSEWKSENGYKLPKKQKQYSTEELVSYWENIVNKYPIFSIEDPLDEEDWDGWKLITERLGKKILLVGDDLFVTNAKRLQKGIDQNCANTILIKPNQIGSISETIETILLAKAHGYRCIMSHRSGETEDTTIADLAVGLNTGYIKTGAPCRAERTAKYNRLLKIEEELMGNI